MLILFHNILLLNNIVQANVFSQKSFNDKIDNEYWNYLVGIIMIYFYILFSTVCMFTNGDGIPIPKDDQAWPKVDFLVTKIDQTIFWSLCSDQTNTNIQKGKLTISNNNK